MKPASDDLIRNIRRFDESAQRQVLLRNPRAGKPARISPRQGLRLLRNCRRDLGRTPISRIWALEIGCGDAFVMLSLQRTGRVGRGVGLDASLGYLKLALEGSKGDSAGTFHPLAGDAARLPLARGFDLVLGRAILHHVPDLDAVLREIRRVLLPGGEVFFLSEPHPSGVRRFRRFKRAYSRLLHVVRTGGGGWTRHESGWPGLEASHRTFDWTPDQIRTASGAAGFSECRVGEYGLLESYLAALWGPWLRGFGWAWHRAVARAALRMAGWVDHRLIRHTPLWRGRTGLCVYLRV